jgi:ribonuclease-3
MGKNNMDIEKIENVIGYKFSDKDKLTRALTRRAYAKEQQDLGKICKDQEIYRTLGDAVLKAILVDILIKYGCTSPDEITNRKRDIENEKTLSEIAISLGIGEFIFLGLGEQKQELHKGPSVLAETFEALIAAIYKDSEYNETKDVTERLLENHLPDEYKKFFTFHAI